MTPRHSAAVPRIHENARDVTGVSPRGVARADAGASPVSICRLGFWRFPWLAGTAGGWVGPVRAVLPLPGTGGGGGAMAPEGVARSARFVRGGEGVSGCVSANSVTNPLCSRRKLSPRGVPTSLCQRTTNTRHPQQSSRAHDASRQSETLGEPYPKLGFDGVRCAVSLLTSRGLNGCH